jgi:nitrogen fixation/metabolism regulation signal transduction histidine kinase
MVAIDDRRPALAMSLRFKFILYLLLIHALFAGVAVYLLLRHRVWLLAVEAVFIISLWIGWRLIRHLFGTLELVNTGAEFIRDSDFTTRFKEVGQPEMDQLIEVYNRMADHLREERTRIQEQHYFLEKLLIATPSGVITLDFDNRLALVNPSAARMLGRPREELTGKTLQELRTPFALALAELQTGESRVLHLTGRRRVKCQRSQFLDRGFPRHFFIIEELTEELRQSEKAAYEKLIRMMSHEVNNSVGSANSLLHSCLHYAGQIKGDDRHDFETALQVVINRTDQLNEFMRSFADVIRLPPPNRAPVDLRALLGEIVWLFRAEAARRRIIFAWDQSEDLEPVMLDRAQMEQAFVNIIKNAIEAIGEDGTVTIRLARVRGRPTLEIEDTGGGLTPEVQANLFTPFFSTKEHGQGIGLTLVQEILDRHGFDFSLESGPDSPTRFRIQF